MAALDAATPTSRSASSIFDTPEKQFTSAIALDGTTRHSYISNGSVDTSDLSSLRKLDTTSTTASKRARIASFGRRLKNAPKRIVMRLDLDKSHDEQLDADGVVVEGITDNPMFNTGEVLDKDRTGVRGAAAKAKVALVATANAIANPKKAAKGQASMSITATEQPYLKEGANQELMEAHEKLERIQEMGEHGSLEEEEARDEVECIEKRREETRDAWITSRHVSRVRVVSTRRIAWPERYDYYETDALGNIIRFQWERYAGAVSLVLKRGERSLPTCRAAAGLVLARFHGPVH